MNEVEKLVIAAGSEDEAKVRDFLLKVMKKKVAEKLVKVLSQESK